MAHPFVDEISNIIDLGTSSVQVHRQQQAELLNLVSNLRADEQAFYDKINYNGKKITSARDLNLLIKDIDSNIKIGTLLPNGEVEKKLSKLYILSDNSKGDWTANQRKIMVRVMNKLIEDGMQYIDKKVVNSRAAATLLSDVRNRAIAAFQAGLVKNVKISPKKTIVDPSTISSYLLSEEELLGEESLNIKFNTIRGSQAARDFNYELNENRELIKLEIISEGNGKFVPLKNISEEMAAYLLSIAKDILESEDDQVLLQGDSLIATHDGPIPIGNAKLDILKQDTVNILKELIPSYSSAIDHFAPQIAIGRALPNIRGFLGEMRASLLMYTLFGEGAAMELISTGLQDKIRMSADGALQEAPIDFVVKSLNILYGFQVKNTISASYSWEGEMGASSFYLQRLQVHMTPEERDFYGAFSYNQPLTSDRVRGDWEDWELYGKVYQGFINNFNSTFADVFKSLAPNIIRLLTRTEGGNIGVFEEHDALTNNFFIMQDKIIAASDIVQALIDNKNVRMNFNMIASENIKNQWYYGKPNIINYNPDNTKIDYEVTLNYKTLFKSAYNLS